MEQEQQERSETEPESAEEEPARKPEEKTISGWVIVGAICWLIIAIIFIIGWVEAGNGNRLEYTLDFLADMG